MPDKIRIMQNFEDIKNNGNQCTEYFNRVIGFVEDIVVSEEFQVRQNTLIYLFISVKTFYYPPSYHVDLLLEASLYVTTKINDKLN